MFVQSVTKYVNFQTNISYNVINFSYCFYQDFEKLTRKEKKPIMVMFYAPCKHVSLTLVVFTKVTTFPNMFTLKKRCNLHKEYFLPAGSTEMLDVIVYIFFL